MGMLVVRGTLETDRTLGNRWEHLVPIQDFRSVLLHVHALQASVRQQCCTHFATLQLSQACLYVATEVHTLDVWIFGVDLRLSAQRRCPDDTACRKVFNP